MLVIGSDLDCRWRDREFRALEWRFAVLCWLEGAIWVVGEEMGIKVPRGEILRMQFGWSEVR